MKLFHKWLGMPIWMLDADGEVRKGRLLRCKDGQLIIKDYRYRLANADGTMPDGYVKKWWPR